MTATRIALHEEVHLAREVPSVDEYCALRVLAGMHAKSREGAAIGLRNTLYGVTLRHNGRLVGMGRIVGDGGLALQVADIVVDPAYQGRGFGKAIMTELLAYLHRNAPPGAHISLLADGPAKHLYEKFGFRETAPASIGMDLPVRPA